MKRLILTLAILTSLNLNAQTTIGETFHAETYTTERGGNVLMFRNYKYTQLIDHDSFRVSDLDDLYKVITKGITERVKGDLKYPTTTRGEELTIEFKGKRVLFYLYHDYGVSAWTKQFNQKQINQLFGK